MRAFYILRRLAGGLVAVLSRTANAALFGGSTAQTLSARAHVEAARGRRGWRVLRAAVNAVFFWEADHCAAAWAHEVARARRTLAVNGAI